MGQVEHSTKNTIRVKAAPGLLMLQVDKETYIKAGMHTPQTLRDHVGHVGKRWFLEDQATISLTPGVE